MGFFSVIIAAAIGFAFGAMWYMALAKPWMEAANIKVGADGKPEGDSPLPYVMAAFAMILVAGMMRHMFAQAGIDTLGKGFTGGLGMGGKAFNHLPPQRFGTGAPDMQRAGPVLHRILRCVAVVDQAIFEAQHSSWHRGKRVGFGCQSGHEKFHHLPLQDVGVLNMCCPVARIIRSATK